MIIDRTAANIITKNMTKAEQAVIEGYMEILSKMAHWDLHISATGCGKLQSSYKAKADMQVYAHGINPYHQTGQKINIKTMGNCNKSIDTTLVFPSEEEASKVMKEWDAQKIERAENSYKLSDLQQIKQWVKQVEWLEEAYNYMTQKAKRVSQNILIVNSHTEPT